MTGTRYKSYWQRLAQRKVLKTRTGQRRLEMKKGKHIQRALSAILVRSLHSAVRELRNEAKKYFVFNGCLFLDRAKKKRLNELGRRPRIGSTRIPEDTDRLLADPS